MVSNRRISRAGAYDFMRFQSTITGPEAQGATGLTYEPTLPRITGLRLMRATEVAWLHYETEIGSLVLGFLYDGRNLLNLILYEHH